MSEIEDNELARVIDEADDPRQGILDLLGRARHLIVTGDYGGLEELRSRCFGGLLATELLDTVISIVDRVEANTDDIAYSVEHKTFTNSD